MLLRMLKKSSGDNFSFNYEPRRESDIDSTLIQPAHGWVDFAERAADRPGSTVVANRQKLLGSIGRNI